ncbi:hypothetical protein VPH35_134643 [Triticum aestivum]
MVDAAIKILPGWQRGMITRPGRLILVNQVMRARPTHHLIVSEAPKWALDKVDKGCRAIFWAGSEEVSAGKCVVSWQRVCKPKYLGGLGVMDLGKHGLALLLRWEWLRRTDSSRPWQGLNLTPDRNVQQAFNSLVKWKLGDGAQILFWKDRWINGACIAEVAPLIVLKVKTQVRNRRVVQEGLLSHAWTMDITGEMSTDELAQFIRLWEVLIEVHPIPDQEDMAVWEWCVDRKYTAASAYKMFCEGGIWFQSYRGIWKSWAPLSCKIFMWLAVQYRVWTSDRRLRHGLQEETSPCYFCDQEEDTVDHLLLQCVFARHVWYLCFAKVGVELALLPSVQSRLEEWWETRRKRITKANRKGFDSFVMMICWTLWKQRNARVFRNTNDVRDARGTMEIIFQELKLWELAGGSGVSTFCE